MNFPQLPGQKQAVKAKPIRDRSQVKRMDRPSHYVGVAWSKSALKWRATIWQDGKNKCCGFYDDEEEAARVYDKHAAIKGWPVNFPRNKKQKQAVKRAPTTPTDRADAVL